MTNIEIQIKLKTVKKSQNYLATKFHRSISLISKAINTNKYPTLRAKIIKHILYLESLLPKEERRDF